ncbi:MAG: GGDEF domain-containing protein [Candidatus Korobacteraceae bacterium]|jgi:diguanylate cyclase (GGDEF)-like protein
MQWNFNALPAVIALTVLVTVFAAIRRQPTKERVNLWLTGWAFILLDAVVEFAHSSGVRIAQVEHAIGLCAMLMASVAFVVSVAPQATTWRRQLVISLVLGLPALAYSNAILWGVNANQFYYAVVVLGLLAVLRMLWSWYQEITPYVMCIGLSLLALAALVWWSIAAGHPDYGILLILASLNFFAGGLYWYRFRRPSAGVLSTVFGFVAWGFTFPALILLATFAPSVRIESETWNIPKYLVAVGMIVTLLEDQIQASEHLAYHDELTGLPNRRLLQDRLLQALTRGDRTGCHVAVLLLDLDDFKEINDTFGHRIGDAVLQAVVARLSSRMRASDTLARSGGDEFTIVSEIATAEGAQSLASAMESALVLPLSVEGELIRTGVSVGYALYPEDGADPTELCAAADKAMYAAKRGLRSQ